MDINYAKYWNSYYDNLRAERKTALWDVSPKDGAALDLHLINQYLDPSLPLIDLGCGTGTQSIFFSKHFDIVIGIDVSQTAIAWAKEVNNANNIKYYCVEDLQSSHFELLHKKFGDCNIYMRGVIHQIKSNHIHNFNNNLNILIGNTGKLYFNEVADKIRDYFTEATDSFSLLPSAMKKTFISNLPPIGLSAENLESFIDLHVLQSVYHETSFLNTNLKFQDGKAIKIPSFIGVIKRKNQKQKS